MNLYKKLQEKYFKKKYAVGFLPPQYKNIELGNLIFGNSRGDKQFPRNEYEESFYKFLERNGFDSYGHYKKTDDNFYNFSNMVFELRPYYWGDDPEIAELPNFVYHPTRLQISWYKYPFRDSYANYLPDLEEFKEILKKCEESMHE